MICFTFWEMLPLPTTNIFRFFVLFDVSANKTPLLIREEVIGRSLKDFCQQAELNKLGEGASLGPTVVVFQVRIEKNSQKANATHYFWQ